MARTENHPAPTLRLRLRLAGWVASDWAERFDGITVRFGDDGSTVVSGELRDQAALFGLLHSVESRGMTLLECSVTTGGAS